MRLFITEFKKIRRRHMGMIYLAAWLFIFIWIFYNMAESGSREISAQGYYQQLLSLPLVNAIILPAILACAQSRICDIEGKGNTFKMLCTMQPRHSIYHIKLAVSALYLLLFTVAETAMIPFLGFYYKILQPLPIKQICAFFFSTFTVSLVLIILQQSLSLLSSNQLLPLFFGIGGTFAGIFSWFFPELPIRYLLPWGYYCVGTAVNMDYDKTTRTVTYYPIPFPGKIFFCFILFGILVYLIGKDRFMKKEV